MFQIKISCDKQAIEKYNDFSWRINWNIDKIMKQNFNESETKKSALRRRKYGA